MARKARKRMIAGDLYDPKGAPYWEALLRKENLGVGVGTTSLISYVGSGGELDTLASLQTGGVRKTLKKRVEY
jgi:hypothetical protein